jgi:hypothetical protein
MLIGLDFMSKYQAEIDLKQSLFCVKGKRIPFIEKKSDSDQNVNLTRIRVTRRTTIPARSVIRIQCSTDHTLPPPCYLIEPTIKTVLAPRVCIVGADIPVMSFMNIYDSDITLFKNKTASIIYEIDEVFPFGENDSGYTQRTAHVKQTTNLRQLPGHQGEDVIVSVRKRPLPITIDGPSTKTRKNEGDEYCVLSTCSSTDRKARRYALVKYVPVVFKDAIGVMQLPGAV